MLRLLLRRAIGIVPVLLVVSLATSGLVSLIPGSPAELILGEYATDQAIADMNTRYGFDRPYFERYGDWLLGAVRGDLGVSVVSQKPVTGLLLKALPVTLELAVLALGRGLVAAVVMATVSAGRPAGLVDKASSTVANGLLAMPSFVLAVFASNVLSANTLRLPIFGWVPLSESVPENLRYAVLPVLVLAGVTAPLFLRVLRTDMATVLAQDFVAAARMRGLPERYILVRHVLRPASSSLFTVVGLVFGYLVGGSIVVETFFGVPGIGLAVSQAIRAHDIAVVQGVVLYVALAYLVINALIDVLQVVINPRLKAEL